MKLKIISIGKGMPPWVQAAFAEYQKRLPKACLLQLIEIDSKLNYKNLSVNAIQEKESNLLLAACDKTDFIVALDKTGQSWSTQILSEKMANWLELGKDIVLLIGGPEGLSADCLKRANQTWSLSALTFPHPMVRIILAEQLYRARSILQGHPYHRA